MPSYMCHAEKLYVWKHDGLPILHSLQSVYFLKIVLIWAYLIAT